MEQISAQIRRAPGNAALRVCLFQLLCVQGQWQRALTQLQAAAQLDPAAVPMAQTYREAIRCEMLRAEVFAGRRTPQTIGEPPRWLSLLIEALHLVAIGEEGRAAALRAEAFEAAETTPVEIDGAPSAWIADADSRLGPICEIILNGQYYWLPFSLIGELCFEQPEDLRDLVWTPTRLTLANGGSQVALIPSRYPGSEQDERFRLCRQTDWVGIGPDAWKGLGQREWISEAGSHPLLDVRQLRFGA
jgi:type VI secretion system protein ImpE